MFMMIKSVSISSISFLINLGICATFFDLEIWVSSSSSSSDYSSDYSYLQECFLPADCLIFVFCNINIMLFTNVQLLYCLKQILMQGNEGNGIINLIDLMSEQNQLFIRDIRRAMQDTIDSALEGMLQKIKPKARYISELHIEEYTDSIFKEIINGDIEISKDRLQIQASSQKYDFQEALRKKFMSQVERQKQELQHKLSYISNSINSMKKYEQLKAAVRSPKSMRQSYSVGDSRVREQQWRKEIKKRQEEINRKKKEIEEKKRAKQEEIKEIESRVKQEEAEKKKQLVLQHMKAIDERMKQRENLIQTGNQRYKQVRKQKLMSQKLQQSFQERESSILEERKKRLAEIRNFHRPIDENELKQHQQKFMELKRQRQQMREREKKMNESRSQNYKQFYESQFYKQILESTRNNEENPITVKAEKVKQFSLHVKEHFAPGIDERKKEQIEELIENEKRKEQRRAQREQELLERSKIKGLQCLDFVRKIPKKRKQKSIQEMAKTERINYPNYLTHNSCENGAKRSWNKILNSSQDRESKALSIKFESQKLEQQLIRKQQQSRLNKQGKSEQIDEEYFKMIKAKLDLLQES